MQRQFLEWARGHVLFLPGDGSPEDFIRKNARMDEHESAVFASAESSKKGFERMTRDPLDLQDYEVAAFDAV